MRYGRTYCRPCTFFVAQVIFLGGVRHCTKVELDRLCALDNLICVTLQTGGAANAAAPFFLRSRCSHADRIGLSAKDPEGIVRNHMLRSLMLSRPSWTLALAVGPRGSSGQRHGSLAARWDDAANSTSRRGVKGKSQPVHAWHKTKTALLRLGLRQKQPVATDGEGRSSPAGSSPRHVRALRPIC